MKIKCTTLFDITRTNVSNRRQWLQITPEGGQKERNQQSNFETVLQVISLRCQPENITDPVKGNSGFWGKTKAWQFSFTIEQPAILLQDGDPVGVLKIDCEGVPMIVGLDEKSGLMPVLHHEGPMKNIHFEVDHG